MTALIVGGDYIDSIRKAITARGVKRIEHWNGRKPGDLRKTLPKGTDLIVILYDYLSHGMLKKVNTDAADFGIPVIHCRRSLGQLCSKLDEMDLGGEGGKECTLCIKQAKNRNSW
jgi:hypothetical protein